MIPARRPLPPETTNKANWHLLLGTRFFFPCCLFMYDQMTLLSKDEHVIESIRYFVYLCLLDIFRHLQQTRLVCSVPLHFIKQFGLGDCAALLGFPISHSSWPLGAWEPYLPMTRSPSTSEFSVVTDMAAVQKTNAATQDPFEIMKWPS